MTKKSTRVLIWIACSLSIVIALVVVAVYWIGTGITATVENNSAKRTTATVVSVAEVRDKPSWAKGINGQLFKVCFTLDNFNDVEADMRQGYQSAEERRLASEGPRCTVTTAASLAKRLRKGNKIEVVYLLENNYRIDIESETAYGEDL